jgi:riboflavin kinase/FMN adenylyltransferase
MQIIEWETFLEKGLPAGPGLSAMTVGIFDGVHRGHKALIERITQYDKRFLPVIITFKNSSTKLSRDILSFRQKMRFFENAGVAVTVVAELTESFKSMKGAEFLAILRECGKMGFLAVGSNFRCGAHRDTDALTIQKLNAQAGISTEIIEVLSEEGQAISASRIRNAIANGRLKEAQGMLGRPFVLDISDAVPEPSVKTSADSLVFSITSLCRILPPPGSYEVLLHTKNDGNVIKAEIQIEEGLIRIPVFESTGIYAQSDCAAIEF